MEKFLSVSGFGDVYEPHFEAGYVLAKDFFDENKLDFLECYDAFQNDERSELGLLWCDAERKANLALYAWNLQDSSMLELEVTDEEIMF